MGSGEEGEAAEEGFRLNFLLICGQMQDPLDF
jgi:hypothetical protein